MKKFTDPEIELVRLDCADVILTSFDGEEFTEQDITLPVDDFEEVTDGMSSGQ